MAIVIDTGGLTIGAEGLQALIARQVEHAIAEADVLVMLVDGSASPTAEDRDVAEQVRRAGKPVLLAANKAEGRSAADVAEFYALGLADPLPVSALHGDHVSELLARALELAPAGRAAAPAAEPTGALRFAVMGRPNVGKSTLINRYLGEERLVTMDEGGTTRDSIRVPFRHDGRDYVLVDTAGIRRRGRVDETVERFSIVKSLQAMEEADAVILLLDARAGVTEQDASLAGLIIERGAALTIGVNKWDGLRPDQRGALRSELERRLPFADFADVHFVSALHGTAIFDLLGSARKAAEAAVRDLATPELNRVLQAAVQAHPTPIARRRRIRLTYAHQGGKRPPVIVIHGNQTDALPQNYRRYLISCFRKAFRLRGTPVRLVLRTGRNPFAGRRNLLTPRQLRRRQRVRGR